MSVIDNGSVDVVDVTVDSVTEDDVTAPPLVADKVGKRMRNPEADKQLLEARIARLQAQLEAANTKLADKVDPVKASEDADIKRLRGERVAVLRFLALNRKGLATAIADVDQKRETIARREAELATLETALADKGFTFPTGE
jgi:uncharacterized membrane protein YccC